MFAKFTRLALAMSFIFGGTINLNPSQIVRGCFQGDDIEKVKTAIREDRGLVPLAKVQDGVDYWCVVKDEAGNFYLVRFIRTNHQILQIGTKIPLDWKFLQKIDEMTCDVEWNVQEYEIHVPTCLKVDTNDLETAINAYISQLLHLIQE
jgi:hypothetical protein